MKVLIIKMSSLGDVIHTLPALTDAGEALGDVSFDWVVEEAFSEVPSWHPLVDKVIPVAIRRWKKTPLRSFFGKEWKAFYARLRETQYDYVIDPQGLIKSAALTFLARGTRVGFDKASLREPLARFAYQRKIAVAPEQHAVYRIRALFAKALGYAQPDTAPDFHIAQHGFPPDPWEGGKYAVFLHGTSWPTKHWPEEKWIALAQKLAKQGYQIRMPQNNEVERARVQRIRSACSAVHMLPKMNLAHIASVLLGAEQVVSVDTGLAHLTAAVGVPNTTLYGPTDPKRIGTIGPNQTHLPM